jgi:hypothetical protein
LKKKKNAEVSDNKEDGAKERKRKETAKKR